MIPRKESWEMDKTELKIKLTALNIPDYKYDLDGSFKDQAYNLLQNGDIWEVFFCERGGKAVLKQFITENEACCYLLERLHHSSWRN
jgi:hypothetical protein